MQKLIITAAVLSAVASFGQETNRDKLDFQVPVGAKVHIDNVDHPFLGALRSTWKWEALERDNKQKPRFTSEPAKYSLVINERIIPASVLTVLWDVKVVNNASGKTFYSCTYRPAVEPIPDEKTRTELNQFCTQQIADLWEWDRSPVIREVPATGFDHERWHRQIVFESGTFRNQIRMRSGR